MDDSLATTPSSPRGETGGAIGSVAVGMMARGPVLVRGKLRRRCSLPRGPRVAPAGVRQLIEKALLVSVVNAPEDATSVEPVPAALMLNVEKVATPATAATVLVPFRVPPPGFVPITTATLPPKVFTMFPKASRTETVTAGMIVVLTVVLVGCWSKETWVAAPAVIAKIALGALVSAPEVAVR